MSRRNILSRQFSANKKSVFQEAHGPNGEREAVAIKKDRVTRFTKDADGHVHLEDLGAYRSGFITTAEMADEAAKPLETKLAKLRKEYNSLFSSPNKAAARGNRVEGLYYQIDSLEKEIAGIRTSVSPAAQAEAGLTDNEVLNARQQPLRDLIARLTEQREKLAANQNRTASQNKRMNSIDSRIADAQDQLSVVEDEFNSRANEGRYWRDKDGNLWQFNRGTTEFISSRTGQKYHDNAILSAAVNYLEK